MFNPVQPGAQVNPFVELLAANNGQPAPLPPNNNNAAQGAQNVQNVAPQHMHAAKMASFVAGLTGLFNSLRVESELPVQEEALQITHTEDGNIEFIVTLPSKLQGEVGNLKTKNGEKKGFLAAVGATVTVEREIKGKINVNGEITFEGNPITIVKHGIKVNLDKIALGADGSIGKWTVTPGVLGRRVYAWNTAIDSQSLNSTFGVVDWSDARHAMPATIGALPSKAELEKEDKSSKEKKAAGTLKYVNFKKTTGDISEEEMLTFLADPKLLKKKELKFIGREKNGESLRLEDNARSRISLEKKMIRGAEQLKDIDFDDVPQAEINVIIDNLEAMRTDMFHSASTADGKEKIWNSMTETIKRLELLKNPTPKTGWIQWGLNGAMAIAKAPSRITPTFVNKGVYKAYRYAKKHKAAIASVASVPGALFALRMFSII